MECKAYVTGGGVISHKCRLDDGHAGPCASPDSPRSESARARWLEGEEARMTLAQFQGRAETTAQRYTENPTPVPGKQATVAEHPETTPTRPGLRTGADVMVAMMSCTDCRNGNHLSCDMIVANEGAVDARDFVDTGCACFKANVEIHEEVPFEYHEPPAEPTKQRPEDQRLPEQSGFPLSHRLLQDDIESRLLVGIQRYGRGLQAMNGRDTFQDMYEELIDAAVYARTIIEERLHMRARAEFVYGFLKGFSVDDFDDAALREVTAQAREIADWLSQ